MTTNKVLGHSIFVETTSEMLVLVFAPDTTLPACVERRLKRPPDNQQAIEFEVLQGDYSELPDEDALLGGYVLRDYPALPQELFLRFELSASGDLSVESPNGGRVEAVFPPNPAILKLNASVQSPERGEASIFVSHAASDAPHALNLVEAIERNGGRCWIAPRDVRAGKDFREEIVTAIEQCGSMVVLISKHANESQHILREIGLAEQYRKAIKPVRLDDSKLAPAFQYQLHALHWVRFEPTFKFVDSLIAE